MNIQNWAYGDAVYLIEKSVAKQNFLGAASTCKLMKSSSFVRTKDDFLEVLF